LEKDKDKEKDKFKLENNSGKKLTSLSSSKINKKSSDISIKISNITDDKFFDKRNSKDYDRNEKFRNSFKLGLNFYEKYQRNLKDVLNENINGLEFIGNERFKGQENEYIKEEIQQNRIGNKFNKEGLNEIKEIDKILNSQNINLTIEQRNYLAKKIESFYNNNELTHLLVMNLN
jgi:hypothetical protein